MSAAELAERTPGARSQAVANPFTERVRPYSLYALALLVATQVFNYVDRQIVSVTAESMKADLGLTDAQLGFLMGASFAVLYGEPA